MSWSYSKMQALRLCHRKYYLAHIVANFHHTDRLRRKAYELKNINSLTMWKGTVVDVFLETVIIPKLAAKQALDFNQLADDIVAFAKVQYEFSKARRYTDRSLKRGQLKGKFCILDIHELGRDYTEVEIAEAYDVMRAAVLNIPQIVMTDSELLITFLQRCKSLIPNVVNRSGFIGEQTITPQIDLIAYDTNWKPNVIDWKVSESFVSDYSRQLIVCGLAVYLNRLQAQHDKGVYEYSDIKLYEVNLLQAKVKQHDFSEDRINDVIDYINLTGGDLELLHTNYEQANPDNFETTENEASCKFCNFRPLCAYLLTHNNEYDEQAYAKYVQDCQLV